MTQPQYRRPGQLWYVGDGYIWDTFPTNFQVEPGRPHECSSKLAVYNPQRKPATVTARFYHVDRSPTEVHFQVEAGAIHEVELSRIAEIPHNQSFWIEVQADVPVLPQAMHEDYTFWDPVPDALIGVAPYPGPLEDETTWVLPDCYQSAWRADGRKTSWYERELFTILNPNPDSIQVRIRYYLRQQELGAEETIEIPGQRVAALDMWEHHPRLIGSPNGPPIRLSSEYIVHLEASAPVLTQTTRRARWTGYEPIIGARGLSGFPISDEEYRTWYYPAGVVRDWQVLPRANPASHPLTQSDNTWNLLFISNVGDDPVEANVTLYYADGASATAQPITVPSRKSILECLHGLPWLGTYTRVDEPFALEITAAGSIVPEVCDAEFEMWSQVCPGAMSSVNFYPGPLEDERTWWLGIGRAGGKDDENVEWLQTYHFFNPGNETARVTLSFLGISAEESPLIHTLDLGPGAVALIDSVKVEDLPTGKPFAVRVDSSVPICAQVFVRTFTRGLPHPRAMTSFIGIPMRLAG